MDNQIDALSVFIFEIKNVIAILRYFFAYNWPLKIYLFVWGAIGIMQVIAYCKPTPALFLEPVNCILFLLSLALAPFVSMLISTILAFAFLAPVYYLGAKLNGYPFQIGDTVCILVGEHAGQICSIYKIWEERNSVRVAINSTAKKNDNDEYQFTEVYRVSKVSHQHDRLFPPKNP